MAFKIGLKPDEYWSISPLQFEKMVKAWEEVKLEKAKMTDQLNHILGGYISTAFNAPKKYPRKPALHKVGNKPRVMTPEEMEKIAMANTKILEKLDNGGKNDR